MHIKNPEHLILFLNKCSTTHHSFYLRHQLQIFLTFMCFQDIFVKLYLSKAGRVHRLRVVLFTEVQVMHVEGTSGDAHTFSYLVVLL